MRLWLVVIGMYAALLPAPASAYLLPLVGAGGVIITFLAGLTAVIFSAGFLLWFKLRRAWRRWRAKGSNPKDETIS